MTLAAKKMREAVLQLLYCKDISASNKDLLVPFIMKELSVSKKNVLEALDTVEKIWQKREELDKTLAQHSQSFVVDRIQKVEKAALRIGLFELKCNPDLPAAVSISEAMRLTRKFSTPEAANFVNALLDSIHQEKSSEELKCSIDALHESEDLAELASQEQGEEKQDDYP